MGGARPWGETWVGGMDTANEDVRGRVDIELRTQHVGWYFAVVSCGFTCVSGLFALVFGRGNVLGPTRRGVQKKYKKSTKKVQKKYKKKKSHTHTHTHTS